MAQDRRAQATAAGLVMRDRVMRPNEEAPEVRDALLKAEEYGRLSERAVEAGDKEQFERMHRGRGPIMV